MENTGTLIQKFPDKINKAIHLLIDNDNLADDELFNLYIANGIDQQSADDILIFLPVVFIRHMLPKVKWPETYNELAKNNQIIQKKYSDSFAYNIIYKITEKYFNDRPNPEVILKIAGRSAEFNALNSLLTKEPHLKIEDVTFTEASIIRRSDLKQTL
ncbi:hypothetical protein [Sediminibacterium ginsengisoli]|uniref:Uncharacterized protein n=1 Tax=Sediminibacterium ginsengisoli TaxID=413434 RepID=A0A1T4R0A1_9BACT|nr:hypothetical protein [Sediminibacterium ginsengisoli]SKA09287.1 hypothetical protein SAMN04488132_11025 [Sediminibacterium ginsengisoli]